MKHLLSDLVTELHLRGASKNGPCAGPVGKGWCRGRALGPAPEQRPVPHEQIWGCGRERTRPGAMVSCLKQPRLVFGSFSATACHSRGVHTCQPLRPLEGPRNHAFAGEFGQLPVEADVCLCSHQDAWSLSLWLCPLCFSWWKVRRPLSGRVGTASSSCPQMP